MYLKSAIQRKAAEKPLGNSHKSRNQRTLTSQWGKKVKRGPEPSVPVGKTCARLKRGP